MKLCLLCCLGLALLCCPVMAQSGASSLQLIPAPKAVRPQAGRMALKPTSRIIVADPTIQPLAEVLREEIQAVSGLTATIATSAARAGDLVLELDASLEGEAYRIDITDHAVVRAGNYPALAFASVTLLQAIAVERNTPTLPRATITDTPDSAHRGLMVDLARNWHPVETLEEIIRLCRFYKVRHLQLHLTDDQSFTFPSAAFPKLATPGRSYTRQQLDALSAYARARGVILVPEIDVPAHATAMVNAMPELFKSPAGGIINFRDPAVVEAVSRLLDEVMDTFPDAPYVHVGADEANLAPLVNDPAYVEAIEQLKVRNIHGLFNHFLNQLNARIAARGKRMIAWEGFEVMADGPGRLDPSVIVMPFDNYKNVQQTYIPAGHSIINTSWYPLYIIPGTLTTPRHLFDWDLYTFGNYRSAFPRSYDSVTQYKVSTTDAVLGAQVCSWEQAADAEVASIRRRLPVMAERAWNVAGQMPYETFSRHLEACDARLQHLLASSAPEAVTPSASYSIHADRVELAWRPAEGYPISYTVFRGTTPDPSAAAVLASNLDDCRFIDGKAAANTDYYYWVRAVNRHGQSPVAEPARGARGTTSRLVHAYEGFSERNLTSIEGANGGSGWAGPWRLDEAGAEVGIAKAGLTYPDLKTSPGHLNVRFTREQAGLILSRDTLEAQGTEGSTLWVSFLIRGNKIGDGHAFIQPAGSHMAVGKQWGNGICIDGRPTPYAMEPGKTYLVVARYTCLQGADVAYLWVNPPLNREPSIDDPGVAMRVGNLGESRTLKINIQQHGLGDYDIDEIRLGHTWRQVLGGK